MSLETEFLGVKLNELEKAYEILVNSKNAKTNAEITENYNAVKMLIVNDEKEIAINISSEEHNMEMSALFSEYMIDSAVYAAKKALLSYLNTLLLVTKGGTE